MKRIILSSIAISALLSAGVSSPALAVMVPKCVTVEWPVHESVCIGA